jgi:hypothetical protein
VAEHLVILPDTYAVRGIITVVFQAINVTSYLGFNFFLFTFGFIPE